jgi:hypothetical protein
VLTWVFAVSLHVAGLGHSMGHCAGLGHGRLVCSKIGHGSTGLDRSTRSGVFIFDGVVSIKVWGNAP